MKKGRRPKPRPNNPKREAARRFHIIGEEAKGYKGRCLFPGEWHAGLCPELPSRRHVIPRASVLEKLKDEMSGKVLEFDWVVGQWAGLLLSSNEDHPVNLEDPATFEPRLLGTHEACTGPYACQRHDLVYDPIDTGNPDFAYPYVRWLTMGRIARYAADLCSRRKFLVDTWKSRTIRSGNKGLRASWARESQFAYTACEKAHSGAKCWGKNWQFLERPDKLPDNLVNCSVLGFRPRLRVAACIYYAQSTRVVVLPADGDEHKMALLHWTEETSRVVEDEERLTNKARETELGDDYGVHMLNELMSGGSGAVAASPASYTELADGQRLEVQKIVMRGF